MLARHTLFLILITGIVFICCSEPDGSEPPDSVGEKLTVTENKLASADNTFGLRLFKQLATENPTVNVFISPLSIAEALAMTYNGARGETKSQMATVLGFDGMSDEQLNQSAKNLRSFLTGLDANVEMQIANSIWYDNLYSFKQDFISTNQKYYDAEIKPLDMQNPTAAQRINDWVDKSTNGKIKQIVEPPLDARLVMMLINAIYFKGEWAQQFPDGRTRDDYFTSQSGARQKIKMMNQKMDLSYYKSRSYQVVDLPYSEGRFSMLIVLPDEGTDVNSVVDRLNDSVLTALVSRVRTRKGEIFLPRFHIEYEKTLNDVLGSLGMKDAFAPNIADFSGIDGKRDLYISDVKHKSYVEVNEEGTEAAAVTSIGIRVTAMTPDQLVFRVDRPFVFAIRERASNTILFIGRITDLSS